MSLHEQKAIDSDSDSTFNQDWAFDEIVPNYNLPEKSQNMLLNFSNNLMVYQNSYKKQNSCKKVNPEPKQFFQKRKLLKRKLNFQTDLLNLQQPDTENKQNKPNGDNVSKRNYIPSRTNQTINLQRLDRVFSFLHRFNTLNEFILPFRVNPNKINHKQTLAAIAFKGYEKKTYSGDQIDLKQKTEAIQMSGKEAFRKRTFEIQLMPFDRRVYSVSICENEKSSRRARRQEQKQKTTLSFTRQNYDQAKERIICAKKRNHSFRKSEHYAIQKTIEQVWLTHSKLQNIQGGRILQKEGQKDYKNKQNQYFSDSKFFTKRAQTDSKIQTKGQSRVIKRQNCMGVSILSRNI